MGIIYEELSPEARAKRVVYVREAVAADPTNPELRSIEVFELARFESACRKHAVEIFG